MYANATHMHTCALVKHIIYYMILACDEIEANPSKHHSEVESERSRGIPARQWLDDVEDWTWLSLNEMWREPED